MTWSDSGGAKRAVPETAHPAYPTLLRNQQILAAEVKRLERELEQAQEMASRQTWAEVLAAYQAAERWHGTAGGYRNHLCRCPDCRAAHAQRIRKQQQRRRGTEPPQHGTENGYLHYGCRCRACTDAAGKARRRREQRASAPRRPS